MQQGEAAVEHDQRETMHPAPLITARLRVDAIPIQLANKVITPVKSAALGQSWADDAAVQK